MTAASKDKTQTIERRSPGPGQVILGIGARRESGPLSWAAGAAASSGRPVVVIRALTEEPGVPPFGIDDQPAQAAMHGADGDVARTARDVLQARGVDTTIRFPCADPAQALLAIAGPLDTLVVGSSATGVVSRVLHGRLVHQLLARSVCPVAIVPDRWTASDEDRPRVVVGWDGSRGAHEALRWASTEARNIDGRLVLVRAYRKTDQVSASSQTAGQMLADARSVAAEQDVTDIRFAVIPEKIDGTARALDSAAAGAHMLVLGAGHGRWLADVARSEISERAAALASCPVVVMPVRA